jgi:spore coat protein U-like protein
VCILDRSRRVFPDDLSRVFVVHPRALQASITPQELPTHSHLFKAAAEIGLSNNCLNNLIAASAGTTGLGGQNLFVLNRTALITADASTIQIFGSGVAVDLMKPYLVLNQFLCTDEAGCASAGCPICGCTPPFSGATCGNNGAWIIGSATSNSSTGPTAIVLSAPVVSPQNLTILNSSVILFVEGISSITVLDGCINFGSDTSLVLGLNATTFALLQQQLLDVPYEAATIATNISARCVSGSFATITVSNGLKPEATVCHNAAVLKQNGVSLSVVFEPNFSTGCEKPPSNSTAGPEPSINDGGINSPATLNIALIVSVSVVAGIVVILVILALTVPPIRKRLLPMLHYNKSQQKLRGSSGAFIPDPHSGGSVSKN